MKKIRSKLIAIVCMLFAVLMILSFTQGAGGTVRGTVIPPEAGLKAFLFSGKDTLSANVANGAFQFSNVVAGSYKLLVEAAPPYRNAVKEDVTVVEGEFTDAGQIELQK